MTNKKLRILIADDHLVVRIGLAALLRRERDLEIVGEAADGLEAVEKAVSLKPDVVVMDLMMPKLKGGEATERILAACPQTKILILTTFGTSDEIRGALDAGAIGALVKDESHDGLVRAIRATASGERILSPAIANALTAESTTPQLSARQQEILKLVAQGYNYPDIARILGISTDGVKSHMRTLFRKLGTASRSEAVTIALRTGCLSRFQGYST